MPHSSRVQPHRGPVTPQPEERWQRSCPVPRFRSAGCPRERRECGPRRARGISQLLSQWRWSRRNCRHRQSHQNRIVPQAPAQMDRWLQLATAARRGQFASVSSTSSHVARASAKRSSGLSTADSRCLAVDKFFTGTRIMMAPRRRVLPIAGRQRLRSLPARLCPRSCA